MKSQFKVDAKISSICDTSEPLIVSLPRVLPLPWALKERYLLLPGQDLVSYHLAIAVF
jgi:hypothetical protein